MAEQTALFSIVMGIAPLLGGIGFAVLDIGTSPTPRRWGSGGRAGTRTDHGVAASAC